MSLRLIFLFALGLSASRAAAAEPMAAAPAVPARAKAAAAVAAPARNESSVTPTTSIDEFRLVSERNIFNPNRTGRRDRPNEEKPPGVDVITLVGTMDSDRGLRAFFDGSESSFRRALHVGESVDKFKVTQIAPSVVDLERDGKSMSVRVGQQLRRPEGADWNLVSEEVVRREAQARAANETKVDPSAPLVIPAGASEIEKRMMERRMKDLKK